MRISDWSSDVCSSDLALAEGDARMRTALGLHPQIAHERKQELSTFERLIEETRYVGEIGLDGGPEFRAHWRDQTDVFERALAICRAAGGRVISLHSRRAAGEVDRKSTRLNSSH